MDLPCDPCNQPESCEARGCFKERTRSLNWGRVPGGTRSFSPPAQKQDPSWEKGVAGEHRPGGGFVPYLDERRNIVGVKRFADRRGEFEAKLRQLENAPEGAT